MKNSILKLKSVDGIECNVDVTKISTVNLMDEYCSKLNTIMIQLKFGSSVTVLCDKKEYKKAIKTFQKLWSIKQ